MSPVDPTHCCCDQSTLRKRKGRKDSRGTPSVDPGSHTPSRHFLVLPLVTLDPGKRVVSSGVTLTSLRSLTYSISSTPNLPRSEKSLTFTLIRLKVLYNPRWFVYQVLTHTGLEEDGDM